MKSGFVSIIGRPNVGKSTLLNSIIGKKLAITSDKAQTTRNNIQGIYTNENVQIVFVDTPGIHKPKQKLGKYLNRMAYYSIDDLDIILFLVDASEKLGSGDKFVIDRLKDVDKPVILVLNKIDKLTKDEILVKICEYKDLYNFKEIVPLSALKNDNVSRLLEVLEKYLPDNIQYYDKETYTNTPPSFVISEIIREKVLNLTDEEVPHSTTCIVEKFEEKQNVICINACIIVDRDSLKKIIIGKQGSMIKQIGMQARKDIEKMYDKQIYLELFVKTIKNWRDREKYLHELGFTDFE